MATKNSKKSKRKEGLKQLSKGFLQAADVVVPIAASIGTGNPAPVIGYNVGRHGPKASDIVKGNVKQLTRAVKNTAVGGFKLLFNHPEWYENYDLKGLVNLNFGRKKGMIEPHIHGGIYENSQLQDLTTGVASVAGIEIALAKPITNANDWNQSMQLLYNTIRSANTGSVNYNVYQLENYVLTVRNLHAIYSILRRAYACLRNVDLYDTTTPASFFAAMGLDYETFSANAANIKQYGNKLGLFISKLMPLNTDLINRTRWMFSNIFADSNDVKSQYYVFSLNNVPSFGLGDQQFITTGKTHFINATATGITWSEFLDNVNNYLDRVFNTSLYAVIGGDILRAFGQNAVYPAEIWTDDMEVPIIYDEAALTQIQNATLCRGNSRTYQWTNSTDAFAQFSCVDTLRGFSGVEAFNGDNLYCLINSYKDTVTPGEAISYTRLTNTATAALSGVTAKFTMNACGTEVAEDMYFVNYNASTNYRGLAKWNASRYTTVTNDIQSTLIAYLWSQFDWAPMIQTLSGTSAYNIFNFPMWDFNNYAEIDNYTLANFHGYAALSLNAVPRLARVSNAELIKD